MNPASHLRNGSLPPLSESLVTEGQPVVALATIMDANELIPLTDPAEIASVQRNTLPDIIGGTVAGVVYGYRWSVERWRKEQARG